MKLLVFRGLLFGCIAMMFAAFTFSGPVAAAERFANAYELGIPDPGDFVMVAPAASAIVEARGADLLDIRSSAGTGPIAPVYRLSSLTDGQSLNRFHMRC